MTFADDGAGDRSGKRSARAGTLFHRAGPIQFYHGQFSRTARSRATGGWVYLASAPPSAMEAAAFPDSPNRRTDFPLDGTQARPIVNIITPSSTALLGAALNTYEPSASAALRHCERFGALTSVDQLAGHRFLLRHPALACHLVGNPKGQGQRRRCRLRLAGRTQLELVGHRRFYFRVPASAANISWAWPVPGPRTGWRWRIMNCTPGACWCW